MKFTLAVVRKGWVWGQDRKMRHEADAAHLHNLWGGHQGVSGRIRTPSF